MHPLKTLQITFLLASLALLGGAYYLYRHTADFIEVASVAQGTVSGFENTKIGSTPAYRPIFQFQTMTGEEIEFTSRTSSNKPGYIKGELVKIYYDPANPHYALADGLFSLWGVALILGGIGAMFLAFGLAFVLLPTRNKKLAYKRPPTVQK